PDDNGSQTARDPAPQQSADRQCCGLGLSPAILRHPGDSAPRQTEGSGEWQLRTARSLRARAEVRPAGIRFHPEGRRNPARARLPARAESALRQRHLAPCVLWLGLLIRTRPARLKPTPPATRDGTRLDSNIAD